MLMSSPRKRVLIVDDSAVVRSLLRAAVSADHSLEVAGTACDGMEALRSLETLKPDLVLLDVEMPVLDGLATLREIRSRHRGLPVIMCSSLTQRGARVTIDALAQGASDYVAKPAGQESREAALTSLRRELLPKIAALTADAAPRTAVAMRRPTQLPGPLAPRASMAAPAIVAIGVSTGGPAALDIVLPTLPKDFPLPVLIVQHMPALFTASLAQRLDAHCNLPVREAPDGFSVKPGTVFIARGDWHLELQPGAAGSRLPQLHLTQAAPENHCRPSVDVLLRSLCAYYGAATLAVILTGMGSDGLAGCRQLRQAGASILAQDQPTSTVWGMPGAVVGAGLADRVLPLRDIGPEIVRLTRPSMNAPREVA